MVLFNRLYINHFLLLVCSNDIPDLHYSGDLTTCIVYMIAYDLKGTLRRRLSHGYYSLTAKYISKRFTSHLSHPQLLQLREQSPIFYHDAGKFDPCSGSFVRSFRAGAQPTLDSSA